MSLALKCISLKLIKINKLILETNGKEHNANCIMDKMSFDSELSISLPKVLSSVKQKKPIEIIAVNCNKLSTELRKLKKNKKL